MKGREVSRLRNVSVRVTKSVTVRLGANIWVRLMDRVRNQVGSRLGKRQD